MNEVVELFSMVLGQTCALKVVDKLAVNSLTHELTTAETSVLLEKQNGLPKAVLSDHGGQFKEQHKKRAASRGLSGLFWENALWEAAVVTSCGAVLLEEY